MSSIVSPPFIYPPGHCVRVLSLGANGEIVNCVNTRTGKYLIKCSGRYIVADYRDLVGAEYYRESRRKK